MENKDNPFIDYYRGMFQKIIHNDDYSTKSAFPIVKNTVTNLFLLKKETQMHSSDISPAKIKVAIIFKSIYITGCA